MDIQFANIEYLGALAALPVIYFLHRYAISQRIKTLAIFRMGIDRNSTSLYSRLIYLFLAGLFFTIIAWANPQMGKETIETEAKTNDVLVALDVSNSMLAQDIAPNRLTAAQIFATQLIDGIKSERIGTMIFAGDAYLQMPLSHDYGAARMFISGASTDMIDAQGTALYEVIKLTQKVFKDSDNQQKILIILSDGEDHDAKAMKALNDWDDPGLIIYTIGVGSESGAPIPVRTTRQTAYKKDRSGNVVKSKLNSKALKELAAETSGGYFHISGGEDIIKQIRSHLISMEGRKTDSLTFNVTRSFYPYFLTLGLLCFLLYGYGLRKW